MSLTLRIDLDYVPWDTPDAAEFGHGEPATLLRFLELARHTGYKFQFFASNRVLRAFPANADAVLNDGHDLDWLCKHPEDAGDRYKEAKALFGLIGHTPVGLATKGPWPHDAKAFLGLEELKYLSAHPGAHPPNLKFFPVATRDAREAIRTGIGARAWTDLVKSQLRDAATRSIDTTVAVRPQVLAKFDPKLSHIREILDLASALDIPVQTHRDLLRVQIG